MIFLEGKKKRSGLESEFFESFQVESVDEPETRGKKKKRNKHALSISFKGPRFSPCPSASATLTSAVVPGVSSTIAAPGASAQSAVDLPEFILPTKATLVRGRAEVSSLVKNRLFPWRGGPGVEGERGGEDELEEKEETGGGQRGGRAREEKLRRCCPPPEAFPFPTEPSPPMLTPTTPLLLLLVRGAVAGRSPSSSSSSPTTTESGSAARVAWGGSPQTPRATVRPTLACFCFECFFYF